MKHVKKRGTSSATKAAEQYFSKNPDKFDPEQPGGMTALDLANKFKINPATIYRQEWWKTRGDKKEQA